MRTWAACLLFMAMLAPALAVDFDCIPLGNFVSTPLECSDPGWPTYDPNWCSCLTSGLTDTVGGMPASIEQAIIYVYHQRALGKYLLSVASGTLKLGKVVKKNRIGSMAIDIPASAGAPQFTLKFEMEVTKYEPLVDPNYLEFDVKVTNVNAGAIQILDYNPKGSGSPLDAAHANGLTYRGNVTSFGSNHGFELTFDYVDPPPPPATHTGIEIGDLTVPNFSTPVLLTFPTGNATYLLPQESPLQITTIMDQILVDPPVERTFDEAFEIQLSGASFRRGDVDGDKGVNLTDAIAELEYLFAEGPSSACMDAADANDDGRVDIADPIKIIFHIFKSDPLPFPGPLQCGPDGDATDALPPCTYNC